MSISVTSPTSSAPASLQSTNNANSRAADGDYKVRSANTSQVKDSDGDYKPKTAASLSSVGVQAALSTLKVGG